ncbi:MAG: hypothetical protein RI573_15840 [Balneolaceae bacterium]|nr:hypothetical protein [Balneolaceae bacterium]
MWQSDYKQRFLHAFPTGGWERGREELTYGKKTVPLGTTETFGVPYIASIYVVKVHCGGLNCPEFAGDTKL